MYTTDILALAAWLKTQSYLLVDWQKIQIFDENGLHDKTLFTFKNEDGVADCAESFRLRKAIGNISDFEFARRELMRIAKSDQPNKNNTEVDKL